MIYEAFPIPIYCELINGYDRDECIEEINRDVESVDKRYFGDNSDIEQIHQKQSFQWLNDQVKHHVKKYLETIGCTTNVSVAVQKSWAIVLTQGGSVARHKHVNSHLSCVFYLQTGASTITFYKDPHHCLENLPVEYVTGNDYNTNGVSLNPSEGYLLIFPSSLEHSVKPYHSDVVRYSISYDIMLVSDTPRENMVLNPSHWKII